MKAKEDRETKEIKKKEYKGKSKSKKKKKKNSMKKKNNNKKKKRKEDTSSIMVVYWVEVKAILQGHYSLVFHEGLLLVLILVLVFVVFFCFSSDFSTTLGGQILYTPLPPLKIPS